MVLEKKHRDKETREGEDTSNNNAKIKSDRFFLIEIDRMYI